MTLRSIKKQTRGNFKFESSNTSPQDDTAAGDIEPEIGTDQLALPSRNAEQLSEQLLQESASTESNNENVSEMSNPSPNASVNTSPKVRSKRKITPPDRYEDKWD